MKRKNNNRIFYVVILLISVLAIGVGVKAYVSNSVEAPNLIAEGDINIENYNEAERQIALEEVTLGGASGPDKYFRQNFIEGYTSGGSSLNASSTLTIARTITATEICENSYIHVNSAAVSNTVAASSLNLTFAATSTLFNACLNYPGAEKIIIFRNNSPTTASTTELVAGTGCDMRVSEESGADNDIEGLNEARVTFRRTDDAFADGGSVDCIVLVEETVVD